MSHALKTVAAAAIALSFAAGATMPVHAQQGALKENPDVYFDLGIDATTLPQDAAGAKAYFAKQAPETQHVLKAACDNYVKHPMDAEMPQTVKFCQFNLQ